MPRVLIVDDEPMLLRTLSRIVEKSGYEVAQADSPSAARDVISTEHIDIALVDYNYHGTPAGLDVLRGLRQAQPGCVRILMSGCLDAPIVIQALNTGAVHQVLQKPLSGKDLRSALDACSVLQQRLQIDLLHLQEQERSRERGLLNRLLSGDYIDLALQPILSTSDQRLIAHEVLLRSSMPELPGPMQVITAAERCNMLLDISGAVASRAAALMPRLPDETMLFVNLHPEEFNAGDKLIETLAPLQPWARRIVLEVTEHSKVHAVWIDTVNALRARGYSIAVDDLGSGYNSLNTLATLQPDYIKVDMSIIRDIDSDPYKQRLMALLAQLAEGTNATLLAEGVETEAEAEVLVKLGAHLVQGYLFGRPTINPDFGQRARRTA